MELELVDWLEREFGAHGKLEIGIGDDAAVLSKFDDHFSVVTHDTLIDKVHFDLSEHDPQLVGRKSLAVNLSDLASMAAQPVAIQVGLVLPQHSSGNRTSLSLAKEIFLGMKPLLKKFNVAISGGDTNIAAGPLVVGVTAIGKRATTQGWQRKAAKPGDQLLVTGKLGGSILGRHLSFPPRVWEAIALSQGHEINAAIDISDGLLLDLDRICQASKCAAELDLSNIPISSAAHKMSEYSKRTTPLEHALSDGEDFELLLSVTSKTWDNIQHDPAIDFSLTRIGEIVDGKGLIGILENGDRIPLEPRGFVHR